MTSVAVLSRAVGPPWADGSINTHVSWARAVPDIQFRWYGSAGWKPTEPNFRASGSGATNNTWGTTQKLQFVSWFTRTRADVFHFAFHPQRATLQMLRPIVAVKRRPLVQTVQAVFAPGVEIAPLLVSRHIVAATARVARELNDAVPGLDVTVIYPVVERSLAASVHAAGPGDSLLRGLGVGEGRRAVLYAGNWSEQLGVIEALEAFALFARDVADVDLIVANRLSLRGTAAIEEGRVKALFDARVAELGLRDRVHVAGLLPDFRRVIAACSALLFPALDVRDGKLDLPLVVLEAMALGVPIGLYDIAPFDEFPFGAAGVVAPRGDRGALAHGLQALLEDSALHAGAASAGRDMAAEQFDPAARATLLRGVYQRALA